VKGGKGGEAGVRRPIGGFEDTELNSYSSVKQLIEFVTDRRRNTVSGHGRLRQMARSQLKAHQAADRESGGCTTDGCGLKMMCTFFFAGNRVYCAVPCTQVPKKLSPHGPPKINRRAPHGCMNWGLLGGVSRMRNQAWIAAAKTVEMKMLPMPPFFVKGICCFGLADL